MSKFSFKNLKPIQLIVLTGLSFWLVQTANAQSCQAIKLSGESIRQWYNPHPSSSDFKLPMPLGMALVFSPIPLGTQGLYGDEKLTYVMGSKNPELFETNLEVRVGSSISRNGEARLLFGKYEVSKAQYVAVMGKGSLVTGATILSNRSKKDTKSLQILSKFTSGKCKGILTQEVFDLLSEPLTFLSYRDYIEFLDEFNLYCISRNDCRRKISNLGPNKDVPGFVRLPAEHEWEFVARGGQEFVAGRISNTEFQNDLPRVQPGKTIKHYAHVGSDPPKPLPIGSREPLFGIYDMLGNAQELMLNPFTSENGFGAVGAYVARGGHFRLSPKEIRVSKRVELQAFRLDDSTNSFVIQYFPLTGIRTVIGYPVIGAAQRLGDTSLVQDFVENYVPPGEAGDIAGNTPSEARELGVIGEKGISVGEELSGDDTVDYFKVSLRNYSTIAINVSSDISVHYEVTNESQESVSQGRSGSSNQKSAALLPGDYWIKLTPATRLSSEKRYDLNINRNLVPDTGLARLDSVKLNQARSIRSKDKPLSFSGYVGIGDTVDTYPIRDDSRVGGIELEVDETSVPVELTYVDEKLNVIRRIKADPTSGKLIVNLNSNYGRSGFVQVSTSPNSATTYTLKVSLKEPYNKIFKKNISSAVTTYGSENVHYEGNLDKSLPALYLPIRIREPRILKVELTGVSADIDMKVLNSNKKPVPSLHVRKGVSPEFFSKLVEPGVYFAEVRLKSTHDFSQFKLLYSAEKIPTVTTNTFTSNITTPSRSNTENWGILNNNGIEELVLLQDVTSYFQFTIQGASKTVQVVISNPLPSNPNNPDLFLENSQGNVLARGRVKSKKTSDLEIALTPGTYYIRLVRDHSVALVTPYEVSISADTSTSDPDFSSYGTLVDSYQDFQIYRDGGQCRLVTVAKRYQPISGWRSERPYFSIGVETNKDTIYISIDSTWPETRYDLYKTASVKAEIPGYGNIPTQWDDNYLQPIDSSGYVSDIAIEGFVKGNSLVIYGLTPHNQLVQIEYSLLGYTKAARRINQLCNADADWIWEL